MQRGHFRNRDQGLLNILRWIAFFSALVLFLSAFGIAYYSSRPATQGMQEQPAEKYSQKSAEGQSDKSLWDSIFPDTISFFTFWLALFTAILALVAYLQLSSLNRAEFIAWTTAKAAKDFAT